jgi:hypothetical protein
MGSCRAVVLALLLASCADEKPASEPEEGVEVGLDARVEEPRDAGRPPREDTPVRDGGRRAVTIPMECEPGRYEGTFLCAIVAVVPWAGKMQFELVGNEMGSGEFRTLSVAAGTKISSDLDSMGGTFTGDLEAEFDCQTRQLRGELANGVYLLASLMPWRFNGPLQGTYRIDDAGVPGFDGTMGTLTTPDLWFYGPLGPSAMCEWQVSRVSDGLDAGP